MPLSRSLKFLFATGRLGRRAVSGAARAAPMGTKVIGKATRFRGKIGDVAKKLQRSRKFRRAMTMADIGAGLTATAGLSAYEYNRINKSSKDRDAAVRDFRKKLNKKLHKLPSGSPAAKKATRMKRTTD